MYLLKYLLCARCKMNKRDRVACAWDLIFDKRMLWILYYQENTLSLKYSEEKQQE